MKITKLELVLENCEVMVVEYPGFVYFNTMSGPPYHEFQSFHDGISRINCLHGFVIGFVPDPDVSESSFFHESSIQRLELCDVAQLEIHYEDGNFDHYFVKWPENCEWKNENQVFERTPDGNRIFYSYFGEKPSEEELSDIKQRIDSFVSVRNTK